MSTDAPAIAPDAFYRLPAKYRNELLAFHAKAQRPCGAAAGFAGEIVFLDNGEGVFPRRTAAKFPRCPGDRTIVDNARRFLREMKMQVAAHYHPNVHWPFDVTFILGVPVAFFRRWEGDLSDFIEADTFGDLGRITIVTQLAAGLAHCHGRGLTHQDLKPENVFVRNLRADFRGLPDNDLWLRPLVADFGSVNVARDKGDFTGSRPYMAPEQWREQPLGEWTSVFVLGVILHELMTRGVHPIGEDSRDWHREVRPLFNRWQKNALWRQWCARGCPIASPVANTELAALIADCLRPSPDERPRLAEVMARLHNHLRHRSALAGGQVDLFLADAERYSRGEEWSHLLTRLRGLEQAIDAHYPRDDPAGDDRRG